MISLNNLKFTFYEKISIKISTSIIPKINFLLFTNKLRVFVWKSLGLRIGKKSKIKYGTLINCPSRMTIGKYSTISGTFLSRGTITIGNFVEFQDNCFVSTQTHNFKSYGHKSYYSEIKIDDYCWIGYSAVILLGSHLKKGSVLGSLSLITGKICDEFIIYGGIPAKCIGKRELFLNDEYESHTNDLAERNNMHPYEIMQHHENIINS